jgi:sterol 14alpha-demethylase
VHSSIHTLMRKVTRAIPVPGTPYTVTPNDTLVASPIMSHMSASHFASPQTWDPHRWTRHPETTAADMDPDPDDAVDYGYGTTSKGTSSPYLPFGAGRHRCIGEKFAYLNLATIILTMVRNLELATLDGTSRVPATDYTSLFSRPVPSAEIRWERRVLGPL